MERALVTGASGAIGAAVARRLAADGLEVWLHYGSNEDSARAVLDDIERGGGGGRLIGFDVTSEEEIEARLLPLISETGPLGVLVNNAGVTADGYMMMLPANNWDRVMEVNLRGFFLVTRACLKGMVSERGGRVVNIGSLAAKLGNVGQVAYAASKAGLEGATRALALEMARWNITVNTVSPGPLDAGMAAELDEEQIKKTIPLGRLGRADEVAATVSFLCREEAGYVTGQVIHVNGGMGM